MLYPQKDPQVMKIVKQFFQKFYGDNAPRHFIFGINPGRFGAGVTGINFTAPKQLRENCGINHQLGNSSELSAEFIYEVIERYGGATAFYSDYFISAVSPLGYIKDGKNLNYYDNKELQEKLMPFIDAEIENKFSFEFNTDSCICIGGEKNYKFFSSLNEERKKNGKKYFRQITPLPHPRFILQYRRKEKEIFVNAYLDALKRN